MSRIERRLCAIMFSDIHGYSRMMGRDEEATLRLLDELNALMKPIIGEHRGTVLKFIGDAVLAIFDSAADAVESAIAIQRLLRERNAGKDEPDRIFIRIGIHIGDIVLKDNDVFGDGVNIAARIEPKALPGGICVSDAVFGMVRELPDIRSENLGPYPLKNIREPVTIHRIITGAEAAVPTAFIAPLRARARTAAPFAAALILAASAAFWGWRRLENRAHPPMSPFTIAVAPFSATPDQARDAARVQQDLIRQILNEGLGREPGVRLIAESIKDSPRSYAEAKSLGQRLDADLVIWGDVLLLNDELAITPHVTLVRHADYVRETDPKALHARISREQQLDLQAAKAKELGNVALLIAAEYFHERRESEKALLLLDRIHPPSVDSLYQQARIYYGDRRWPEMERSLSAATKLAPDDLRAKKLLAHSMFARGDLSAAARQLEELVRKQPRDVDLIQSLAAVYAESGQAASAEKLLRQALDLNPKYSLSYVSLANLYYRRGDFHRAADTYAALVQVHPNDLFGQSLNYLTLRKSGRDRDADARIRAFVDRLPRSDANQWPQAIAFFLAGRLPESRLIELIGQGEVDTRLRRECEGYYYLGMARLLDKKDPDGEKASRVFFSKSVATGLANYYEYNLSRFELAALDAKKD